MHVNVSWKSLWTETTWENLGVTDTDSEELYCPIYEGVSKSFLER